MIFFEALLRNEIVHKHLLILLQGICHGVLPQECRNDLLMCLSRFNVFDSALAVIPERKTMAEVWVEK